MGATLVPRTSLLHCCGSSKILPAMQQCGTGHQCQCESDYCIKRGISENTVADVVKRALAFPPKIDKSNG